MLFPESTRRWMTIPHMHYPSSCMWGFQVQVNEQMHHEQHRHIVPDSQARQPEQRSFGVIRFPRSSKCRNGRCFYPSTKWHARIFVVGPERKCFFRFDDFSTIVNGWCSPIQIFSFTKLFLLLTPIGILRVIFCVVVHLFFQWQVKKVGRSLPSILNHGCMDSVICNCKESHRPTCLEDLIHHFLRLGRYRICGGFLHPGSNVYHWNTSRENLHQSKWRQNQAEKVSTRKEAILLISAYSPRTRTSDIWMYGHGSMCRIKKRILGRIRYFCASAAPVVLAPVPRMPWIGNSDANVPEIGSRPTFSLGVAWFWYEDPPPPFVFHVLRLRKNIDTVTDYYYYLLVIRLTK